jgi:hypothetical protein
MSALQVSRQPRYNGGVVIVLESRFMGELTMFARHKTAWALCGAILFVACLALSRAADVSPNHAAQAKVLAAAASKAYATSMDHLAKGFLQTPDECYQWSRRILDAEVEAGKGDGHAALEASAAHLKRMQGLDRLWQGRVDAGEAIPNFATAYYLLEAQSLKSRLVN